jgi:PilZ domain
LLIFEEQIGPIPPNFFVAQMKPKHFEREVRRARHLSARIMVAGRAHCECQVLDISTHGAKVIIPSDVPDRFELAFSERGQHRVCEVVWGAQDARRQVHFLNKGENACGRKSGYGELHVLSDV